MSGDNRSAAGTAATNEPAGAVGAEEAVEAPKNPLRWKALVVLCAAFFMVQLDAQIVLLALPSMQAEIGLTAAGAQWVMSSYLLTFGGLLLLGGRAADVFGRRRMFAVGMALFLVASLIAGLAWDPTILIAARVGQGISAAIISPTALSLVMVTFTDKTELGKALAIWAANGAAGAMAALLIGGPINDLLGWEWIFFINVPVALLVLALTPKLLPESRVADQGKGFDPLGALTITLAMVAFIYAVVETPVAGWLSGQTLGLLAATVVLFGLFVVIEKRVSAPMVPLSLFRNRNLVGGNVVMLLVGMVTFGAVLIISLYAQQVLGYTALAFGVSTVIYTVMSTIGSQIGARVVAKIGFRTLAVIAMALMAIGTLLLTQVDVDGTYFADLFWGLLLFGLGLGMGFVGVTIAALADVPGEHSGVASGINTAGFQMGGALGVAVATSVAVTFTRGGDQKVALNEGFQAGFWAMTFLAVASLLVGLVLFKAPKPTATAEN
ncbi:MFS transporter [Actinosynnema sp. NPDC002837]